jgi:flagellar motor protein MotB
MKRSVVEHEAAEEGSYLASVSDLLVGLLFVFIILLMAFALNFRVAERDATVERGRLMQELAATARERQQLERERDQLLAERHTLGELLRRLSAREAERLRVLRSIVSLLAEREVRVVLSPEEGVLRLPEELLFDSGSAVLRGEGERALRELAAVLARVLPCYANAPAAAQADCPGTPQPILEAVLIEGHTDDVPIAGGPFRDNWELAAARGVHTYKTLVGFEPALELLRNGRGEALLGIAAYEARRPVVPDATPEARRRNRRIDLRFLLAAPSEPELAAIRAQLAR